MANKTKIKQIKTANFKHHIIGALKQKDFYIFFINLG